MHLSAVGWSSNFDGLREHSRMMGTPRSVEARGQMHFLEKGSTFFATLDLGHSVAPPSFGRCLIYTTFTLKVEPSRRWMDFFFLVPAEFY